MHFIQIKMKLALQSPVLRPSFFISCVMFRALFYKVSKPCLVLELQLYRLRQGSVGLDGQ